LDGELAGALSIGILMGYEPATEPGEFLAVAHLAAKAGVPTYTHVRELVEVDPATPVDGSEEIAIAAAGTGAVMLATRLRSADSRYVTDAWLAELTGNADPFRTLDALDERNADWVRRVWLAGWPQHEPVRCT
jgi:hypothetical protein